MATTVKNTARGPRGLRNASGELIMIESGQSATGDFSASEVKDFKAMLAYEAGEAPAVNEAEGANEPKALSSMNKGELLDVAKAESVAVADDATKAQIIEAIEKARAAAE